MSEEPKFGELKISVCCTQCGQQYQVSSTCAGKAAQCRKCGTKFQMIPMSPAAAPEHGAAAKAQASQRSSVAPGQKNDFCAICQALVEHGEKAVACSECSAVYHSDCWEYNKGCALYGCPQAPPTEKLNTLEMPMSYWGREQKNCPACNQEIQAAAIRCRHCGATFQSAQPEDAAGFRARAAVERNLPGVRRSTVWLLVLSILPCTAPPAAIFGAVWYFCRRKEIQQLPALHCALCKLAIGVAIGQSVLGLIVAILYSLFQG
ncbi:MAG: hypothetical protein HZA50_00975 [Planctomycetes bacterium]|nr:hypothetical protein [Planctomycetota bacterium]